MPIEGFAEVLKQTLSENNEQRNLAEQQLENWSNTHGFFLEVCRYACSPLSDSVPPSQRMLCLSIIKQKVSAFCTYSTESVSSFASELVEVLHLLIMTLSNALASSLGLNFRSQLAATVGQIVLFLEKHSSAENAVSPMLSSLHSSLSEDLVSLSQQHIIVRFFHDIFNMLPSSSLWKKEILSLAAVLMAKLNLGFPFIPGDGIMAMDSSTRREVLKIKIAAVNMLYDLYVWAFCDSDIEGSVKKNMKLLFLEQVHVFQTTVTTAFSSCSVLVNGAFPDELLVLELLILYNSFIADVVFAVKCEKQVLCPKGSSEVIQHILESLFADASEFTTLIRKAVSSEDLELLHDEDYTYDGDVTPEAATGARDTLFQRGLTIRWSLIAQLQDVSWGRGALHQVVMQSEEKALQYLQLLTQYASLPERDRLTWELDVNAYLRQEEERADEVGWSVRDVVCYVFVKGCQGFGPVFLHSSLEQIHESLFLPPSECPPESWRDREVSLLFIGEVLSHCYKLIQQCGGADFGPLTQVILDYDITQMEHPVLASRSLFSVGRILRYMKKVKDLETLKHFCGPLVEVVGRQIFNPQSPLPPLVRASGCCLLQDILPISEDDVVLREFFHHGYASLFGILGQSDVEGEFLYLLFDVLVLWLSLVRVSGRKEENSTIVQTYHNAFEEMEIHAFPILFKCWRRYMNDPSVADCVCNVFRQLIKISALPSFLFHRLNSSLLVEMPWIQKVLQGNCDLSEHCTAPYLLRMLNIVFKEGSEELAAPVASGMLSSIVWLILTSDESAILQASTNCLCSLLLRCPPRLVAYPDTYLPLGLLSSTPPSGEATSATLTCVPLSQVLDQLVQHLVKEEVEESSLLSIGNFLVAVMENGSLFSYEQMTHIVTTIVTRLSHVKTSTVGQQLLAPLVVLLQQFAEGFFRVINQGNLTSTFFTLCFTYMKDFRGTNALVRTVDSLLRVLTQWDLIKTIAPEVESITIPTSTIFSPETFKTKRDAKNKKMARKAHRESGQDLADYLNPANASTEELPLPMAILVSAGKAVGRLSRLAVKDQLEVDRGHNGLFFPENADGDEDEEAKDATTTRLFQEDEFETVGKEEEDDDEEESESEVEGVIQKERLAAPEPDDADRTSPFPALDPLKAELRPVMAPLTSLLPLFGPQVGHYFSSEESNRILRFQQYLSEA